MKKNVKTHFNPQNIVYLDLIFAYIYHIAVCINVANILHILA